MSGAGDAAKGLWASVKRLATIDDLIREVSEKLPARLSEIRREAQEYEHRMDDKFERSHHAAEAHDREVESRLGARIDHLQVDLSALQREVTDLKVLMATLVGRLETRVDYPRNPAVSIDAVRATTALPPETVDS